MKKTGFAQTTHHNALRPFAFAALLAVLAWAASCTKTSSFGADLLDDETADFEYTDTLTVRMSVVQEDSVYTSDRFSSSDYFLCGKIVDPIFGSHESEIFTLLDLSTFSPAFRDSMDAVGVVDSVVMYLALDSKGFYGDTMQRQSLRVFRINPGARLENDSNYYSPQSLPADEEIGAAEYQILPSRRDVLVYGYGENQSVQRDSIGKSAFIRVPLSNAFGTTLLGLDSAVYTSDTSFWHEVRGLRIQTNTPDPRAMSAFDLNNTTYSRITVFYKINSDTVPRRYHFFFSSGNKFTHFTHDYTGSEAANHLGVADDALLFVQGMGGLKIKVDFPSAANLDDVVINKAELELTAAALLNDNLNWYWPIGQVILRDTSKTAISDVYYAAGPQLSQGFDAFGGAPRKETAPSGETIYKYRMLLTERFQDMVDQKSGDVKGTTILLHAFPSAVAPGRAVFYGQRSSSFPAKLNLKYTRLPK